jgi:hypothetical protein
MNERELDSTDIHETPQWLDDVLRLSLTEPPFGGSDARLNPPSEAFLKRCNKAASIGASIAKLRADRRRIGFVPMSLAEYIQGLIKVADVKLAAVLESFGMQDISALTSESARKFARLAQELGISLREVLVHARIGFVERVESVPVPLLLAHHRSTGFRDELGECEAVLGLAEAEYDVELLNELRRIEFEIRAAYKQGE